MKHLSRFFLILVISFGLISCDEESDSEISLPYKLTVDPGNYKGKWSIVGVDADYTGEQEVLITDNKTEIVIGFTGSFFLNYNYESKSFEVENEISAQFIDRKLNFNNETIKINPQDFLGDWLISGVSSYTQGPKDIVLIPGIHYSVNIGITEASFILNVNKQIEAQPFFALEDGIGEVKFKNVYVKVNPQQIKGNWQISRLTSVLNGEHIVALVPNNKFLVYVGGGNGALFTIEYQNGKLLSSNSTATTVFENELLFNAKKININTSNDTGWSFVGLGGEPIESGIGSKEIYLMPGISYSFIYAPDNNLILWSVDTNCNISPGVIDNGADSFFWSCTDENHFQN